jgi:hypothetical protein
MSSTKRPAEKQLKEIDPKQQKTESESSSSSKHFEFHDAKPMITHFDDETGETIWMDPEWDPRYTIGIFGSRGTGKSFLARWLCSMMYHKYPEVYVFTETKMNKYWAQMVNPQFIFEGYRRDILQKILANQAKKTDLCREGKYKGNPLCLIIWDDCLPEDMNYDGDGVFKQIYFNGRHYMIGNIMNSQYFFKIPKRYRQNIDFVFSMMQESENQLTAFYNEFSYTGKGNEESFGARSLMNSFLRMFARATADKKFILFSQRDKSVPNSERIYSGKAEDPGIFWMGSALYWSKNIKHLEKIKSGKAREEADWDLDEQRYKSWGILPPSKGDANKGTKGNKDVKGKGKK